MPTVTITQSRRSPELKRRLIAAITEVIVVEYAVRPDQVAVHFVELDDESWGRAGLLAADFPAASQASQFETATLAGHRKALHDADP